MKTADVMSPEPYGRLMNPVRGASKASMVDGWTDGRMEKTTEFNSSGLDDVKSGELI